MAVTCFTIFLIAVAFVNYVFLFSYAAKSCHQCPPNEEYVPCIQGVCRAMNCSQRGSDVVPCPDRLWPEEECDAGCICKENYLRRADGYCVPENKCNCPCRNPFEEYTVSRKPNCPLLDTCTSIVARIICDKPEVPGCTCKSGYLRLKENSKCIPICDCPQMANALECQCRNPNEEYSISQKPNCPQLDTCRSIVERIICDKPEVPGCTCIGGYLRSEENASCIPICDCPEMVNASECQKQD